MAVENHQMVVEELSLAHVQNAGESFDLAVRELQQVMKDLEAGRLESGSKVKLKLEIEFEPNDSLDGVDVTCRGSITLPKYPSKSVHALNRLGKLKVVKADQGKLPGILGARVVPITGE